MGAKNDRKVKQSKQGSDNRCVKSIADGDVDSRLTPSWFFSSSDKENWPLDKTTAGQLLWSDVFPSLKGFESMNWKQIVNNGSHYLVGAKLHKKAEKVLEKRQIEKDALFSLRISGTIRMYGTIENGVFHLIWFDPHHGDNPDCVCRSRKKCT